jgi:transposase, IS5 family
MRDNDLDMPGFFDFDERLSELSAKGDDLERVKALVAFEMFRPALEAAVPRSDRSKDGQPPFDHVLMFKVLILQAMHSLSDERTEFLIKDRLSSHPELVEGHALSGAGIG